MLTRAQIKTVEQTIKHSLKGRLEHYKPETMAMPFHARLLGKDRLALYAFIHSLNTNFGPTVFEPIAILLASSRFKVVKSQVRSNTQISTHAQTQIQKIIDELIAGRERPDKKQEVEVIRKACQKGEIREIKPTKVDIYLEDADGEVYLIDLKAAKPNKGNFKEFKRTLLERVATSLLQNPQARVHSMIAIPYNPYEPEPYNRWTMAGMLDLYKELKVAKEFWDFLGGEGTYNDLLDCFERVGMKMRDDVDAYFAKFNQTSLSTSP